MNKFIALGFIAAISFSAPAMAQSVEPMPTGCVEWEWIEDIFAHDNVVVLEENEFFEPVTVISRYDNEVYHIHPTDECAVVYQEGDLNFPN